jgi:hypothetical protein
MAGSTDMAGPTKTFLRMVLNLQSIIGEMEEEAAKKTEINQQINQQHGAKIMSTIDHHHHHY